MSQRERWLVLAAAAVFWLSFVVPVLMSGQNWGIWDWDHHLAFYEVERLALVEYGVPPLWAPYLSGGSVSLQHPLSSFLWPDVVWVLVFGVPFGVKLLLAFRFAVGLAGALALSRDFGLGSLASLLSAFVMTGSGAWTAHVAFGHFEWTLFAYVPWALLACRRAGRTGAPRWIAIAAACIAALYLGGGIYLLVGFAFLLGLFSFFEALRSRRWQALAWPVLALALSAPLSAAKLLPTASYFAEHPRESRQSQLLLQFEPERGWLEIPRTLQFVFLEGGFDYPLDFSERPSHVGRSFSGVENRKRWDLFQDLNHNAYVGPLVLLLALAGLALPGRFRAVLAATLAAMLFLVLSDSLQRAFGFHPWWALKKLPGLGSLGVSGRFVILAVVPLALLAGSGLQALLDRPAFQRAAFGVGLLAVAGVGGDLSRHAWPLLAASFPHPPVESRRASFATFERPLQGFDLATVRARVGATRAHSNLVQFRDRTAVPQGAAGYRGEAWLRSGAPARLVEIGPNIAVIEVDPAAPDVLVLNQHYVSGWRRTDRAARVFAVGGLAATEITPEDERVRLEFRPSLWRTGLVLTLLSVVSWCAALVVRARRSSP